MDDLEKRIIEVVSKISEIPATDISSNSTFEELSLSSLDAVMIEFELEEEFGVAIPDSDVYTITSVQELIDGVRQLLEKEAVD